MKKRIFSLVAAGILALACVGLASCDGGQSSEDTGSKQEAKAEAPAGVSSTNGIVTVGVTDGFNVEVNDSIERVTLISTEDADDYEDNCIIIQGTEPDGSYDMHPFHFTADDNPFQYREGEPYSEDMMAADIETYLGRNGDTYALEGTYAVSGIDCTTITYICNGEEARRYFGIMNEKPFTITVIGGDCLGINDDAVLAAIDSVTINQ